MELAKADNLVDFDNHVQKVLEYIDACGAKATVDLHKRIFSRLKGYLVEMGIPYTEEAGANWIDTQTGDIRKRATGAIGKLNQVYQGKAITGFYFGSWSKRTCLSPAWSQSLETYLDSVRKDYAPATLNNQRLDIQKALLIIQDGYKMCEPSLISIEQIAFLYARMIDRNIVTETTKQHTLLSFCYYLKYLYGIGIIERYVCMAGELFSHNVSFWSELPPVIAENICNNQAEGKDIAYPPEELLEADESVFAEMSRSRYSYSALKRQRSHTKVFYCYLKWQNLPLTEGAIRIWLEAIKPYVERNTYYDYQRALSLNIEWIKNHGLK